LVIYLINLILIPILAALLLRDNIKKKKLCFALIVFLQLVFLLGLRNCNVGTDTNTYIQMYNTVASEPNIQNALETWYEPGFACLSWVISCIWNNSQFYLFVVGIITMLLFFRYIWRNTTNLWMSIYLFVGLQFYYLCFNTMRQALAMAILMNSIELIEKKKYKPFLLVILLACLIHQSSIIFLIILLLSKIKFTTKICFIILSCSISICILMDPILKIIVSIVPRYAVYFNSVFFSIGNLIHPLMYLLIFIFVSILSKYMIKQNTHTNLLLMMSLMTVALYIVSIRVYLLVRLVYYFAIPLVILIPLVIGKTSNVKTKRFFYVAVTICIFVYNFFILKSGTNGIVPYIL
jgi:Na+/phosphate symporter